MASLRNRKLSIYKRGCTVLAESRRRAHTDQIELSINPGADINATDAEGKTILMIESSTGFDNSETIQNLVAKGADVNAADAKARTALIYAAHNLNAANLRTLIKLGADVNHVTTSGDTALITICSRPEEDPDRDTWWYWIFPDFDYEYEIEMCAVVLIDAKADVQMANSAGMTAFRWARRYSRTGIMRMILAAW